MVLGVLSSVAIISLRKRAPFALLCVLAVCVLCLFPMLPFVGLHSVIVAFVGHTF